MLGNLQPLGIEECGQTLQLLPVFATDRAEVETRRREKIGHGHEVIVGLVRIDAADANRAEGRRIEWRARPLPVLALEHVKAVAHIIQLVEEQVMLGVARARQALALGGGKEHLELPFALQEVFQRGGQQRAAG